MEEGLMHAQENVPGVGILGKVGDKGMVYPCA